MVILTGGEPMLYPELVKSVARKIRSETKAPIVLYTAKANPATNLIDVMGYVDGITLTLHTPKDIPDFVKLQGLLKAYGASGYSLRLNVFNGISLKGVDVSGWKVKDKIKWIKNCPLPTNEVFMRLAK